MMYFAKQLTITAFITIVAICIGAMLKLLRAGYSAIYDAEGSAVTIAVGLAFFLVIYLFAVLVDKRR